MSLLVLAGDGRRDYLERAFDSCPWMPFLEGGQIECDLASTASLTPYGWTPSRSPLRASILPKPMKRYSFVERLSRSSAFGRGHLGGVA